ncbi:conserved Plasmodium protein, unknown function [Plasmodium ovale]|uniref:CH-like domain-containing protein n=1 Tax=Plasmodium ovale TaxID=36330 RepID=A0A1C3KVU7_PLAOA|nr:conserved Plasmodium protein, unknown function [Plasmodium ovale]
MELPREIIKWLQCLNLPYSFKNIKSASNGIVVSEIINTYMPQSIHMNSLENGFSKEIKKKNWKIIKRTLASLNIFFDETSVINSDKNAIANLFIQLYECFNQEKSKNEYYCVKEEEDKLLVPSFARSTITQKVRESNVHDIVDEEKKMISTYEIIKREEQNHAMMKEKEKEERENKHRIKHKNKKDASGEASLFHQIEKSSSIMTINDISEYADYTDIKTLDSFIKDKNNLKSLTFGNIVKEVDETEKKKKSKKDYEDEDVEDIICRVLSEFISDCEFENQKKDKCIRSTNRMNSVYKYQNFTLYDQKYENSLYGKFYTLCFSNKCELVSKILDQLTLLNENFCTILCVRAHQFFHIWRLFFPVICSARCDKDVLSQIMSYLRQFLSYLKINDLTSSEILCSIMLRSLSTMDIDANKDVACLCELITLIINNDRQILMSILRVIKNNMSLHFFYIFLSTILSNSLDSAIYKKDVKDIYLYYIFVGLHANREGIILRSLGMLNTLSLREDFCEIVLLSSLLYNILEMNNTNYDIFLFTISANVVSKMVDCQGVGERNAYVEQFIQICCRILKNTKRKELLHLYFIYSHEMISKDDNFFDIYLTKFSKLRDEEQKVFISNNVFDVFLKKLCNYKTIKNYFGSILNDNLNTLNRKMNTTFFNLLLTKEKWREEPFLVVLKNYILFDGSMDLLRCLEVYKKIFERAIHGLFSENSRCFELCRDILTYFWFSPNGELKSQSFEISLNYLKSVCSMRKHNIPPHGKEYLEKLEKYGLAYNRLQL